MRWAAAEGISMFGTSVSSVALPLVVYEATGSAAQTGALYALRVVPYLLFGLVAGPVADRYDRRRLIIGGNMAEGLLVATIPVASVLGVLTVAQVYVVALLAATAFVFSDAAVFGAVPALVGPGRLAAANGFLASLGSGAEIAGPAIGGALAALIGPTNVVWIDAGSFLAAAAVQSTIRSSFRTGAAPSSGSTLRAHVRRGLSFIRHHRVVATLLGVGFGNSFAFGAVLGLIVPFAVEQLGLADRDGRIGVLYSAGAVGSLITGLVVGRLFRPERVVWIVPSTIAVSAMAAAGLATSTAWAPAAALLVVFGWSVGITVVVGITYRQLAAPDDLRSSVNVIGRMVAWGGQPFGAFTGALVAQAVSVRAAYLVAVAVMVTSAVAAAVLLARRGPMTGD
ncbi:MAG: MFS transporter [Ilumatobacteraceae bacterium]